MFITLEGIEGSGKSTQAKFIAKYLSKLGLDVVHTREPGGTLIAEKIRSIFLEDNNLETITAQTELLLMFAARSQHLTNLILPALKIGKFVICERFSDASVAYQGGGRGINFKYINLLIDLVQGDLKPDLVILLDIDVEVALKRINNRSQLDRVEQEQADFFQRTKEIYLQLAHADPKRYYIIDGNLNLENINLKIINILQNKLLHI